MKIHFEDNKNSYIDLLHEIWEILAFLLLYICGKILEMLYVIYPLYFAKPENVLESGRVFLLIQAFKELYGEIIFGLRAILQDPAEEHLFQ